MSRKKTITTLVWSVVALVFLTAGVCLEKYYLTFSKDNIGYVKKAKNNFYDKLRLRWLKPDIASMKQQVRSGEFDQFDLMILRTAMGRRNIRSIAPHAYGRLPDLYRNGWWNDDFVNGLNGMLEDMDHDWKEARMRVVDEATTPVKANLQTVPKTGMKMTFPVGTTTAEIGSRIEILFTIGPGSKRLDSGQAVWATKQHPSAEPYRVRSCTISRTDQTTAGMALYRMTMDMSASPGWIYPETEPTWIQFRGPGVVNWKPESYKFSD